MASGERSLSAAVGESPVRQIRVCILGGACIGLSTALALSQRLKSLERPSSSKCTVSITVVSENFPPDTTSNVAAGVFRPFSITGTSQKILDKWTQSTWKWLTGEGTGSLATAPERGVFPCFMVEGSDKHDDTLPFAKSCVAFHMLGEKERADLRLGTPLGWTYLSLVVQSGPYLAWLQDQCRGLGVQFRKQAVASIDELDNFDLVVNCTGLQSRELFSDESLTPVRGQVIRVAAPWVHNLTMVLKDQKYTYILPNRDFVVLGGTLQEGNWKTDVDPADTEDIWRRCCDIVPSLKSAKILETAVGLRPYRKGGVRLELEHVALRCGGKLPVVHNYGHGGSGFTIHWGCANDAVDLVIPVLEDLQTATGLLSKL